MATNLDLFDMTGGDELSMYDLLLHGWRRRVGESAEGENHPEISSNSAGDGA